MAYAFTKTLDMPFDAAIAHVTDALKAKSFGVMTTIDVKATMKAKLDKDMPGYIILGACNPGFAFRMLEVAPLVGTMMPCNFVVRELENGQVEVAAVDMAASVSAIDNAALTEVAAEASLVLKDIVESL